jgi:ABC-type molybdate transport system substrate-binding protein
MKRKMLLVMIPVIGGLVLGACSDDGSSPTSAPGGGPATNQPVSVQVYPQLTGVVSKLITAYKAEKPAAQVAVAPVDQKTLSGAVAAGMTTNVAIGPTDWVRQKGAKWENFGRNVAVVAVPAANPKKVTGVTAFNPASGLRTSVCSLNSFVGDFSLIVLKKSGITPNPTTVKNAGCRTAALTQLSSGQLDAALVFRTGISAPSTVRYLEIPDSKNIIFPFSEVIGTSPDATAFGEFLRSDKAKTILTQNGFQP